MMLFPQKVIDVFCVVIISLINTCKQLRSIIGDIAQNIFFF